MAHHELEVSGDVDAFAAYLDRAIPASSMTTQFECGSDHWLGDARMVVRVYERFSATGSNRVSLCISVLAVGTELSVSAVSSGGSQAMIWKLNRLGENAFLEQALAVIGRFRA